MSMISFTIFVIYALIYVLLLFYRERISKGLLVSGCFISVIIFGVLSDHWDSKVGPIQRRVDRNVQTSCEILESDFLGRPSDGLITVNLRLKWTAEKTYKMPKLTSMLHVADEGSSSTMLEIQQNKYAAGKKIPCFYSKDKESTIYVVDLDYLKRHQEYFHISRSLYHLFWFGFVLLILSFLISTRTFSRIKPQIYKGFAGASFFLSVLLWIFAFRGFSFWLMLVSLLVIGLYPVHPNKEESKKVHVLSQSMFGAVLVLMGLFIFYILSSIFSEQFSAKGWTERTCEIENAFLIEHTDDDGTSYSIGVKYTHSLNGETYTGNRYRVYRYSSGFKPHQMKIVDQLNKSNGYPCFVNPQDPTKSAINNNLGLTPFIFVFPLFFIIPGFIVMIDVNKTPSNFAFGNIKKGKEPESRLLNLASKKAIKMDARRTWFFPSHKKKRLSHKNNRWSAIWIYSAAFVYIFTVTVNSMLEQESLFTPYGYGLYFLLAVSLFFLYKVIGILRIGKSPMAQVFIGTDNLYLGAEASLFWKFNVSMTESNCKSLAFILTGTESAKYPVGSITETSNRIFFLKTVFEMSPKDIVRLGHGFRSGYTSFTLPAGSMHSFEAPHNSVSWTLELKVILDGAHALVYGEEIVDVYQLDVLPRTGGEA